MPGIAINSDVLKEIQRQLNHELGAAHAYLALAIWCEDANLKGFSAYFTKQAGEEREHAMKMIRHLVDRGVAAELGALPAPRTQFRNVMEIAQHAQSMERANTQGINACYAAALKHSDYPAQILLQWFINEQVEEEAWTDELVERVERANCAGGLSELDRHIERHLTGNGLEDADGD